MTDRFTTYLQQDGCSKTTVESYKRTIDVFLSWCNQCDYGIENMTYKQCTDYFKELQQKNTKYNIKLKDTTIKSYVGAIKKYFKYLVNEDIYTVSPLEKYDFVIDKAYEHDLLSERELGLLYTCFPTIGIKLPNCKSVAIRNKVITGFMVF